MKHMGKCIAYCNGNSPKLNTMYNPSEIHKFPQSNGAFLVDACRYNSWERVREDLCE